ncbi:MAG: DnaA regulatory inactivator Hda [Nevskiales bacterium]|nr:DnaA regulatory inactivator Hda [Nevskiales bacterium]
MKGAQLPLAVRLRDTASFESFVPGPNLEAVAALQDLTAPVLLYGAPGSGRTHLLQATCRVHAGAYLPLSELAPYGPDILEGFGQDGSVILDDLDVVTGDRAWCTALIRMLDGLRAQALGYVCSAGHPPDRMDCALPDLRTRLSQMTVLGLKPLSDTDRGDILRLRAHQRGLALPDEVSRWLLRTQSRDTATLLDALDRLDQASLTAKRRLTLPFAQAVLDGAGAHRAPD